jgi:hypothetical protein
VRRHDRRIADLPAFRLPESHRIVSLYLRAQLAALQIANSTIAD